MAKASRQKPARASTASPNYRINQPKPIASAVAGLFGRPLQPFVTLDEKASHAETQEAFVETRTWEDLGQMRDAVGALIRQHAESIHESVELVKRVGCEHIAEFNAAIHKTNADLESFMEGYRQIQERHLHRTGLIQDPDQVAEWLSVFEDYQAFHAHFEGVMHHTLITFTEFALEAQARLQKQAKIEDAEFTMVETVNASGAPV